MLVLFNGRNLWCGTGFRFFCARSGELEPIRVLVIICPTRVRCMNQYRSKREPEEWAPLRQRIALSQLIVCRPRTQLPFALCSRSRTIDA